jgi:predicted HTH transcriptional regulator
MATVMTELPQPRTPAASSRRFAPAVEGEQESVFEIRESYLRVIFPYRKGFTDTDGSDKILDMMQVNPQISAKALAEALQLTPRAIEKQIAELKKQGLVVRIGERKGGHWEVLNHGE